MTVLRWLGDNWLTIVDVFGVAATATATWLAVVAIRNADRQAQRSAEMVSRERRIDFELEQLSRVHTAIKRGRNVAFTTDDIQLALRLLPRLELPRATALYVSPEGLPDEVSKEWHFLQTAKAGLPIYQGITDIELPDGRTFEQVLLAEVESAIERRLGERQVIQ